MKKQAVIALLGTLSATPVLSYQGAVSASVRDASIDFDTRGSDRDVTRFTLGGTYYFKDVETNNGPLAVAGFLDRASYVSGAYTFGEYDFGYNDYETNSVGVYGQYIDADSGWLAGGRIRHTSIDFSPSLDTTEYNVHVGKYIDERTSATVSIGRSDTDTGYSTSDATSISVSAFRVGELPNNTHYDASVGLTYKDASDGDDAVSFYTSANYYPTNSLSLGLGFSRADGEYTDTAEYELMTNWFVNEALSIGVSYEIKNYDNKFAYDVNLQGASPAGGIAIPVGTPDGDNKAWSLNVGYRF